MNRNKSQKKKNANSRSSQPSVSASARNASSSSALGTVLSGAVNLARNIPVIGPMIDTAKTVASSILSFLSPGASLFETHYTSNGQKTFRLHPHLELKEGAITSVGTAPAGSILMRYELSIGPEGSRSRVMGSNFEKYKLDKFQLSVTSVCAATEPGQLAYVYVPDPSDRTLDTMQPSTRLESILGRENIQIAQIWQNTVLSFRLPPKEFYVSPADNVERLISPGAVYVIAVTPIDETKLPTIRQTSSLTFLQAANAVRPPQPIVALLKGEWSETSVTLSVLKNFSALADIVVGTFPGPFPQSIEQSTSAIRINYRERFHGFCHMDPVAYPTSYAAGNGVFYYAQSLAEGTPYSWTQLPIDGYASVPDPTRTKTTFATCFTKYCNDPDGGYIVWIPTRPASDGSWPYQVDTPVIVVFPETYEPTPGLLTYHQVSSCISTDGRLIRYQRQAPRLDFQVSRSLQAGPCPEDLPSNLTSQTSTLTTAKSAPSSRSVNSTRPCLNR